MRLSRFTFQPRQAERYRDGRILLAGDAAHLFAATGAALNAGLLDTVNLAWKLAAAIHSWAPAGLLDTYHGERQLAGARALRQTRAQVALRHGNDPAAEALREVFQPLFQSRWFTMLITLPSGARTKNRRTPHGSVVMGFTIS